MSDQIEITYDGTTYTAENAEEAAKILRKAKREKAKREKKRADDYHEANVDAAKTFRYLMMNAADILDDDRADEHAKRMRWTLYTQEIHGDLAQCPQCPHVSEDGCRPHAQLTPVGHLRTTTPPQIPLYTGCVTAVLESVGGHTLAYRLTRNGSATWHVVGCQNDQMAEIAVRGRLCDIIEAAVVENERRNSKARVRHATAEAE